MYLIFDTETTGLPKDYNAPVSDSSNWPRLVQIAWQLHDDMGKLLEQSQYIIRPEGFEIPFNASKIHGITDEIAQEKGTPLEEVLQKFSASLDGVMYGVGHNISFDKNIVGAEYFRLSKHDPIANLPLVDTKDESTEYCALPGGRGGKYKWPTLTELHLHLFQERFDQAHNAIADVDATARCFLELIRKGVIAPKRLNQRADYTDRFSECNPDSFGMASKPVAARHDAVRKNEVSEIQIQEAAQSALDCVPFVHLHNHTHYSILQSCTKIEDMLHFAKEQGMKSMAITDLGNMHGVFDFYVKAKKFGIKPIIGCELYVCSDMRDKTKKDNGYRTVFLAKNLMGYSNLSQLVTQAHLEGFYYVPRIDKALLLNHREGLIVLSGGAYGEVPNLLLESGEKEARRSLDWWNKNFSNDFYLEVMNKSDDAQAHINRTFTAWSAEGVAQVVATNENYYISPGDAQTQDILSCIKNNEYLSTPVGKGRGFRMGFTERDLYLSSSVEVVDFFRDCPDAVANTLKIDDKIEEYPIEKEVILPKFDIPIKFLESVPEAKNKEVAYLRHLSYAGAEDRFDLMTDEVKHRLDFELQMIEKTGYPGYFLIVQDYIKKAKEMGVFVGPGRGSAAGSLVAYCTGITNVDPLKYKLLFERFINPDRVSLPDIDVDFDDEGRDEVIAWICKKYGHDKVAQIITYNLLKSKSSIRDTARVLQLPLSESNRLAKAIPNNLTLREIIGVNEKDPKFFKDKALVKIYNSNKAEIQPIIDKYAAKASLEHKVLQQAVKLDGLCRSIGVHPCGLIIAPKKLSEVVPLTKSKDSELLLTQYDNNVVESAGLLKMDFLGLTTLTYLKKTLRIIEDRQGEKVDLDTIPLDDIKTYELFQKGDTVGVFQFESEGMQKYLIDLKPDNFDDIIAMIALYRPGPMDYLPQFIKRKHGLEDIVYDLPEMEEYLSETYGVTVYQEQVMLLSQKLAGFTKGQADVLRKAMGKKQVELLHKLKEEFKAGCEKKKYSLKVVEKIWKDWEAFASYAFNKSHAVAYSILSYQTAYLKANYPEEYMAALLSTSIQDQKKLKKFLEACRYMDIEVLPPDINESNYHFTVNKSGQIRFGMAAIKGIGRGAIGLIVSERSNGGMFRNFSDFLDRMDMKSLTKKNLESLIYTGCFEQMGYHRAQFFHVDKNKSQNFLERALHSAQNHKASSSSRGLFSNSENFYIEDNIPDCPKNEPMRNLILEKEYLGRFVSSHPNQLYAYLRKYVELSTLEDLEMAIDKESPSSKKHWLVMGVVDEVKITKTQRGLSWVSFSLEDLKGRITVNLFDKNADQVKGILKENQVFIVGFDAKGLQGNSIVSSKVYSIDGFFAERVKSLGIRIDIDMLTEVLVDKLSKIISNHRGSKNLKLTIFEAQNDRQLELYSNRDKVFISHMMIRSLLDLGFDLCI